jgi:hypothetical protein
MMTLIFRKKIFCSNSVNKHAIERKKGLSKRSMTPNSIVQFFGYHRNEDVDLIHVRTNYYVDGKDFSVTK